MLMIRLQRTGRKHEPTFRVVLTDSKNGPKSGKFLEVLGSYDPREKNTIKFDGERIKEWMSKGAKVSDTLHNLLVDAKILTGKKINVLPKKTPIKKEGEEVKTETVSEVKSEEPKTETAPVAEAAPVAEPVPVAESTNEAQA